MNKSFPVLLLALAFCCLSFGVKAQNCTVNAGVKTTICPGQPFVLSGTSSGLFTGGSTPVWSQISGPSVTVSATTVSGGIATATVTGYAKNVDYGFRLTAKCTDGSLITDDVIYNASDLSTISAGTNAVVCPGSYTMQASPLGTGESGVWTVISGSGPLPAPVNSPNGVINFQSSSSGTAQVTTYRWMVTNGKCSAFSDVVLTNLLTEPVDANRGGANQVSVACYNATASYTLNGSYAITSNGQTGTWSFVSGPSTPTITTPSSRTSTVTGMIQGIYVLRWTVTGPCQSGFSDLTIIVDAASQAATVPAGNTQVFCDGRTSFVLTGTRSLYAGETVQWTAQTGAEAAVFSAPNASTTTVTGLDASPGKSYNFTYKVTNAAGCSNSATYTVRFVDASTVSFTTANPLFLSCDATIAAISYTTTGGTDTQYALISAPPGSTIQTSLGGLNNFRTAPNSGSSISGFDKAGTYVLRYRRFSNNGTGSCYDGYSDITIIVSKAPTASNSGTRQTLACNVFNATLAGNQPSSGTGRWSQVSGPNIATIADRSLYNTAISNLINGVYMFRWIISGGDGSCSNMQSDVQVVVASPQPTTSIAGSAQTVCNSTPVVLDGNLPVLNETGTWTVSPSSGIVFSNTHDPKAIVNGLAANSAYTFTWTIVNACNSSSSSVTITTTDIIGPKQAVAGPDQCLGAATTSFTLAGNAPSSSETGTWTLLAGAPNTPSFTVSSYNTSVTGATVGTYLFEWKLDRNGCRPTRDTVAVTISAPVTPANAGPDQSICGNLVNLTANTPVMGTGKWVQTAGAGGAVIPDPALPAITVTGLTDGRYIFRWTISNNACTSSFDEVTVNVSTPPTPANAGPDQAICNLTTATLAANAITAGTGMWSIVSGPGTPVFSDVKAPNATVTGLKFGTYVLRWTSRSGPFCPVSSDDMVLSVTQNAAAGADQNLCNVSTIVLRGNEGSTGNWTTVSGPNTPAITANGSNGAIIENLEAGSYVFQYEIPSVGPCPATTDNVTVSISAAPSAAAAGPDQSVCQTGVTPFSFTMAAAPPTSGTGTWSAVEKTPSASSWPTITNKNDPFTTITGTDPGIFLFEWRVANGNCSGASSSVDLVKITVYREPYADAGPDQNNVCSQSVVMKATNPPFGVGTWSVVSQPSGSSSPSFVSANSWNTIVLGVVPGEYVFRWTVTNGSPLCADKSDDVKIVVTSTPPTIANAGADFQVCNTGSTASTLLAGNAPEGSEIGTWTVVNEPSGSSAAFSNANSPISTVSGLIAGTYTLRWTIINTVNNAPTDCISTDDVLITVTNSPTSANAGSDQSICLSSPVTLAATSVEAGRGTGTWSVVSKPAAATTDPVFTDVNAANSALNGLIPGDYILRWTTSNGTCTPSADDVRISVSQCEIAVAKSASTATLQNDGSYNITFTFKVKNTGDASLNNVQVIDDLTSAFQSPKTYTIISREATGGLTANPSFNGNSDKSLLTSASSSLGAGIEETITLVVNVKLN